MPRPAGESSLRSSGGEKRCGGTWGWLWETWTVGPGQQVRMLSNREQLVVGFYFFLKIFFPFIKVNKFIVIKRERVEER